MDYFDRSAVFDGIQKVKFLKFSPFSSDFYQFSAFLFNSIYRYKNRYLILCFNFKWIYWYDTYLIKFKFIFEISTVTFGNWNWHVTDACRIVTCSDIIHKMPRPTSIHLQCSAEKWLTVLNIFVQKNKQKKKPWKFDIGHFFDHRI